MMVLPGYFIVAAMAVATLAIVVVILTYVSLVSKRSVARLEPIKSDVTVIPLIRF